MSWKSREDRHRFRSDPVRRGICCSGALMRRGLISPRPKSRCEPIGQRLGRSCSERQLNAIATRGDALLAHLLPRRACRARARISSLHGRSTGRRRRRRASRVGAILDRRPRIPAHGPRSRRTRDTVWLVYRKAFRPGTVGLGVNGLDRSPVAHYVVFIRSHAQRPRPTTSPRDVTLDPAQPRCLERRASPPQHQCGPRFPQAIQVAARVSWRVRLMLQPSHGDRHRALLATGRVWKTRVVSSEQPSQVAIAFGTDAARELVWTWTTSARRDVNPPSNLPRALRSRL